MTSHEANGPGHPGSAMPPATTTRLEQDDRVRGPRDTRSDSDKSAAELEREVERERAELTSTVNEIRRSLSPGQLVDQALDYAKHSGGREFAENLGRNVRQNPLPVLLVGVGIAWLMTSSGQRPGRTGAAVAGAADGAREHASSMGSAISDAASRASATAAGVASSVRDAVSGTWRSGSQMAASASETASRAGHAAREGFHDAESQAAAYAHDARDRLVQSGERVRNTWSRLAEEQPLVLGALGVALGAVIATALPSTRTEDRLMGGASDAVKDQVRDAAHRQYEHAKEVATETFGEVTEDLDRRGLSGDAITEAAASTTEKVHDAVDRIAEGAESEVEGKGEKAAAAGSQTDLARSGALSPSSSQSEAEAPDSRPPGPRAAGGGSADSSARSRSSDEKK